LPRSRNLSTSWTSKQAASTSFPAFGRKVRAAPVFFQTTGKGAGIIAGAIATIAGITIFHEGDTECATESKEHGKPSPSAADRRGCAFASVRLMSVLPCLDEQQVTEVLTVHSKNITAATIREAMIAVLGMAALPDPLELGRLAATYDGRAKSIESSGDVSAEDMVGFYAAFNIGMNRALVNAKVAADEQFKRVCKVYKLLADAAERVGYVPTNDLEGIHIQIGWALHHGDMALFKDIQGHYWSEGAASYLDCGHDRDCNCRSMTKHDNQIKRLSRKEVAALSDGLRAHILHARKLAVQAARKNPELLTQFIWMHERGLSQDEFDLEGCLLKLAVQDENKAAIDTIVAVTHWPGQRQLIEQAIAWAVQEGGEESIYAIVKGLAAVPKLKQHVASPGNMRAAAEAGNSKLLSAFCKVVASHEVHVASVFDGVCTCKVGP
jgi:hypothetical protein